MSFNELENRIKVLESELRTLRSDNQAISFQKEMSLRKAIENAIPSGIAVVDDTGKQVYVNQAFCKMVGWDEDELLGKRPPYSYWCPQNIGDINNAMKQTLDNNAPKEGFDLIFCHKSGKLFPVQVIIAPFLQDHNKKFFLANVIDITERKKAEDALVRSQLLLKSSIESQKGTIIFSIDRNYNYLYFNKAHWESMKFAYNKDVGIGMNILDCISSETDRKLAKENYDQALNGESHSIIQTFGKDNLAYYESFFNPILNEKNEIIGCSGLARNITDRKQAEMALKESETKVKEIIDQISDGIIVFDEQKKIIIWNKGAELICGLKSDAVLNQSIVDLQYQFAPPPSNDKTITENEINGIISMQTPEIYNRIIDDEIMPLNSDSPRNIQRKVFPIELNGYNLFCMVFRDTTEIKRYEKELLQLSSDKDKFYSIIAQYLYTPFNLFNNFSKLMAEELDSLSIKEIQKMAVMMSKSATNLYGLLDNMLQWTKINQGNIAFKPQILNFAKVSQESVSILKPIADAKNITINHLSGQDITVSADVFMLKTILRNLVSNAIKYITNNGHIDISAQQTHSDVIISVLDNETRVAPDYLTNFFDISHLHSTLGAPEDKATTLGLILCKEFVEKHEGKIWVESRNGKGLEYKFTLPVTNSLSSGINY